jgi:hypothetical protein
MTMPVAPTPEIRVEIEELLRRDERKIGSVFRGLESGVTSPRELVELGASVNTGAVSNLKAAVKALLEGAIPTSATRARQAAWAIGDFLEEDTLTPPTRAYLEDLRSRLREKAASRQALQQDVQGLDTADRELNIRVEGTPGVYVYSFRHYLQHPNDLETGQCWLKVGSTTQGTWKRVTDQSRLISMPEDPKLLRIYHSSSMTPAEIEDRFHRVLDAAGHERSSARHVKAGVEWFSTTLELLDTLAEILAIEIESLETPSDE